LRLRQLTDPHLFSGSEGKKAKSGMASLS
jgi:hypothetical protein